MSARAESVRRYFFAVTAQQYSRALTWTLIAPLLVLLLAAFVWPIVKFLSLSVLDPSPTLAHFAEIFDRAFYWTILLRTFRTGLIVTVMALLLGYPVAWLMANVRGLWAAAIAAIVILPLWISILVRTFVWFIFLGRTGTSRSTVCHAPGIIRSLSLRSRFHFSSSASSMSRSRSSSSRRRAA